MPRCAGMMLLLLFASFMLAGCDPLDPGRHALAGTVISGTENIDCSSGLKLQPGLQWAAFWKTADKDEKNRLLPAPNDRLVLLHLESLSIHIPYNQPAPDPAPPHSPGLSGICWKTAPASGVLLSKPHIRGRMVSYDRYAVDFAHPEKLIKITNSPVSAMRGRAQMGISARQAGVPEKVTGMDRQPVADCETSLVAEWNNYRSTTHIPEIMRGLQIENPDFSSVALVFEDGRELARYQSKARFREVHIGVDRFAWSTQGQWLAYTVSSMWQSWFHSEHSFVTDRAGRYKPRRLAGRVGSFSWVGDDWLLGCTRTDDGKDVLQYWNMPPVPQK